MKTRQDCGAFRFGQSPSPLNDIQSTDFGVLSVFRNQNNDTYRVGSSKRTPQLQRRDGYAQEPYHYFMKRYSQPRWLLCPLSQIS